MKGWLDNFGKADNANNSNVSMSEDFVGLGYNTKGRNYSPAWGGQFQKGGNLFMQQTMDVVQPPATVPYLRTKDPAEFYKAWIQNPEYARRQLLTGYSSGEDLYMPNAAASRESRLGALEEMTPITYSTRQPSKASPGVYGSPSYVNINPLDYIDTSKEAIEAHELAHIAGAMGEVRPGMMSAKEQEIFKKSMLPVKEPVLSGVQGSKEREASKRALEDWKHSQEPDEAKADLDALRFMMYDKGIYDITKGKKFTEADFEKAKQSLGKDRVFKRLTDRVGKKNFVNLMNVIAKGDEDLTPIAMNGASMPGAVGFTYARVAGAAPSKGKYAKKTMASAQTGIMTPMLLARNVLNYFYPSEEAAPSVSAAPVEYKKGLTDELLKRQAYKESTFNPAAVSPAGYKGLTQIGEQVLADYSKKKGGKKLDPFNPKDAVELQKFAMDDLYNASFINKPDQPDSVRLAKTLAAYNWGRGNLFNYLNEQKQKGVDIYDSYDWLNDLPKETSDYVNKILLQEDESFNKNYKRDSTNPKYKDITSLYDKKKFGGKITTAQNGQEMRFYQNGLDWKPKSMQNGGEEDIKTIDLPEIVVTPYDEQYPFYQSLSEEEKKYLNDKGPIGRGIRAIATTGKRGQTAKDISSAVRDVQQTGAEFTGIPGTIRFSDDPLKNLTGTGKTLLDLAMVLPGYGNPFAPITGPLLYGAYDGINPITGEQMFSEGNLQGAFDTLDALGMATGAVALLKQPVQKGLQVGAKTAGRFLTTKTPLRNTYKINPFAVKEPDVILTRTQKPGQTAELRRLDELESKGLDNLNFIERYEYNQLVKSPASQAPGYGRGFSSDLGDIGYYADPSIQATRGYEGFPEILKMRLPATEAAKFNVAQNPLQGYISYSPKREFLLPKELVYSAESFTPTVGYGVGQAGARGPGSLSNFIRTANAEQRIANTPDWLRGYPSIANKSSDVSKSFKSEIDWSKWNPETPKYPELIKEYNKIEEATKKAGTWMQNPDGSVFKGTPEQFIQEQSSYFKKAYPQGYNQVYRGVATNTSFPNFNESTDPILRGPRGIFTANKELAGNYVFGPQGWQQEKTILTPFDPDNTPGIFELIYPKGKQITRYQNLDDWTNVDLARTPTKENIKYSIDNIKSQLERRKKITEELASTEGMSSIADQAKMEIKSQENRIKQLQKYYDDFDKVVNDESEFNKMKKVLGEKTTTDDIARYIPKTNLRSITLQDLIDSGQGDVTIVNNRPGNYLKSRVGNVGFFDLKNPNVYKGIVPAGIATSLTFDQQKNGGITKDNQGYWNPNNWGKPVEIDSNIITMEGVNQPLLGISDTGDKKLMKPGKNYKFKGKKVTEYPVAELGINQLDAQPMKKLNQLLNFTNNPDKDNWLDKYN